MRSIIITGSVLAGLAVAFGAFGSHGLKSRISPQDLIIFETGVKYQMYHALGLVLMGILGFHFPEKTIQLPFTLMTLGILIFSGSLYILVVGGVRWMGAITPIGGIALISSWLLLAYNLFKYS